MKWNKIILKEFWNVSVFYFNMEEPRLKWNTIALAAKQFYFIADVMSKMKNEIKIILAPKIILCHFSRGCTLK